MDKKYWNKYYQQYGDGQNIAKCSTFANFCLEKFFKDKSLSVVELGSGNGRDAIYFAHHKHNVIAIDQSTIAIDIEKHKIDQEIAQYLHPKNLDFVRENYTKYNPIDVFYSRFTIHSITTKDEDLLLPSIYDSLGDGGLFCIEVRTVNDPLFGIGDNIGDNTYITNHSRRFIDSNQFVRKVLSIGFKLIYFTEENNLSKYKEDNPVLMRLILKK